MVNCPLFRYVKSYSWDKEKAKKYKHGEKGGNRKNYKHKEKKDYR